MSEYKKRFQSEINPEIFINLAENHFKSGDFVRAEKLLLQAEEFYPDARVNVLLAKVRAAKTQEVGQSSGGVERIRGRRQEFMDIEVMPQHGELPRLQSVLQPPMIMQDQEEVSTGILQPQTCPKHKPPRQQKTVSEQETVKPENIAETEKPDPALTVKLMEQQMLQNVHQMRSKILFMEIQVAKDKMDKWPEKQQKFEDTIGDVENWLLSAQRAFTTENDDEANKILLKAENQFTEICMQYLPKVKTVSKTSNTENTPFKTPDKSISAHSSKVTVKGNKEDVGKCIKLAEAAFEKGNLEKAVRFLERSERIYPTAKAKEVLERVRAAITARDAPKEVAGPNAEDQASYLNEEIILYDSTTNGAITAEQCIKLAQKAFTAGKLDKSMRFLRKAQNIDPSVNVDSHIKDVHNAWVSIGAIPLDNNKVGIKEPNQAPPPLQVISDNGESEATTYLEFAKNALEIKDYNRAEKFLNLSVTIFPTRAAEELRQKIDTALANKIKNESRNKEDKHKKSYANCARNENTKLHQDTSNEHNKEKAQKYINIAKDAIKAGNYVKANEHLDMAERMCNNCNEILTLVAELRKANAKDVNPEPARVHTKSETETPIADEPATFESNSDAQLRQAEDTIAKGVEALTVGNLTKAMRLLNMAQRLHPTEKALEYLKRVHERILEEDVKVREQEKQEQKAMEEIHRKETVETYTSIAMKAIDTQHYDTAKTFSLKAYDLDQSEFIIDLTKNIDALKKEADTQDHHKNKNESMRNPQYSTRNKSKGKQNENDKPNKTNLKYSKPKEIPAHLVHNIKKYDIENENLSKKYIANAKSALEEKDFKTAENEITRALNYFPCRRVREVHLEVLKAQLSINPEEQSPCNNEYKVYKAKGFMEIAERAYIEGKLDDAHSYFKRAVDMNPTDKGNKLLSKLTKAKKSNITCVCL